MRVNISIKTDTLDRLNQYAEQEHMSRSQAITKLVWDAKVKNSQVRGQMSVDDLMKSGSSRKGKRT